MNLSKEEYYNLPRVREMIMSESVPMHDREVFAEIAFMSSTNHKNCVRLIWLSEYKYLDNIARFYKFYEKDYNMYVSCSKYTRIPFINSRLSERSKITNYWFNHEAKILFQGQDILHDFDVEKSDFKTIKKECLIIMQLYKNLKIPHYVFSSGNGLHLFVKFNNHDLTLNEIKEYVTWLKKHYLLKSLCLVGVGTLTKLRKCLGSYVHRSDRVVNYLTKDEVESFNYEMITYGNENCVLFNPNNEGIKNNGNVRKLYNELSKLKRFYNNMELEQ